MKIVLAQAVPTKGKEAVTELLNEELLRLARASSSAPQPVVLAETNRDFNRNQDMDNDALLPNAGGAKKIAATLSGRITPLLAPARRE